MTKRKHILILIFLCISIIPVNAQIEVACVGNSITLGLNSTNPYPDQLGVLLDTNYVVRNYGHASTTILKNGEDPYWLVTEHLFAISRPRNIVIISFGTNATRPINWDYHSADFESDYLALIQEFKQYESETHTTEFIFGLPPPIFTDSSPWGVRNTVLINEVIPKINSLANQVNATIADFYNPMLAHPEWFNNDKIHPNARGDSVIAQIVFDAIQKLDDIPTPDNPPAKPSGLITIPGNNSISLRWNANKESDIAGYQMFRTESIDVNATYIGGVPHSDTTYTDNNVIIDKEYYYTIKAIDINRNTSPPSELVKGKTLDKTPPSIPKGIQIIHKPDTVSVIWTPNLESDISHYNVYRNTDSLQVLNGYHLIGTTNYSENSFNDLNYTESTKYFYGVSAVDVSNNQSAISNPISIETMSRPISADTTIVAFEDVVHTFSSDDFIYYSSESLPLDKIIFIDATQWDLFKYDGINIQSSTICEDITKFTFNSEPNDYGDTYAAFKYKVIDSFGSTSIDTNIVIIDVASVNDEPNLDPIDDVYLVEDSHDIFIPISGINSGQIDELQKLSIQVIPRDTSLIKIGGIQYTSPETSGYVIIDPIENVYGSRPVTIRIWDDGGTENGGINYTDETFYLYITPTNDPPIFTNIDKISIDEDSETIIELNGVQAGPWENNQEISILVSSSNTNILPTPILVYTSPDTSASLMFSTIPNVFGNTSITLFMSDDGGTDLGGNDTISYTIPVEIISINDKPTEFNIVLPHSDSTLVIDKHNFNDTFIIGWEVSEDVENDKIYYNLVFNDALSKLSRYGIESTTTEYYLKDILAATDTISITNDSFSVVASDGVSETFASNSGFSLTIDGRPFAPANLNLDQNFPNPFNHRTLIGFDLPKRSKVSLTIFDLLGKEIIKLIDNEYYERGYGNVTWSGLDDNFVHVPAGIYFMQINVDNEIQHKKLLLLK